MLCPEKPYRSVKIAGSHMDHDTQQGNNEIRFPGTADSLWQRTLIDEWKV